jgi:hypothetical protein
VCVLIRLLIFLWVVALGGVGAVLGGRTHAPHSLTNYLDTDAACFVGICRGATTADEAEAILREQPYFTGVRRRESSGGGSIFWHYDPVPVGLSASRRSELRYDIHTGIVQDVKISVSIPLWEIAGAGGYGSPVRVATYRGQVQRYVQVVWRDPAVVMAGGRVGCPLSLDTIWKMRVTLIQFPADVSAEDLTSHYAAPFNTVCEG